MRTGRANRKRGPALTDVGVDDRLEAEAATALECGADDLRRPCALLARVAREGPCGRSRGLCLHGDVMDERQEATRPIPEWRQAAPNDLVAIVDSIDDSPAGVNDDCWRAARDGPREVRSGLQNSVFSV